jgi:hypothetical protein
LKAPVRRGRKRDASRDGEILDAVARLRGLAVSLDGLPDMGVRDGRLGVDQAALDQAPEELPAARGGVERPEG